MTRYPEQAWIAGVLVGEMRTLLRTPERRARGWFAKDMAGTHVVPGDAGATSWCLLGAMHEVVLRHADWPWAASGLEEALHAAAQRRGFVCAQDANDTLSHADSLTLLDEAVGIVAERVGGTEPDRLRVRIGDRLSRGVSRGHAPA